MPARSTQQRKYLFWKFGSDWVHQHHFDKLAPDAPYRVGYTKSRHAPHDRRHPDHKRV